MQGFISKHLVDSLYRSGTIKKRVVWLEKVLDECEEELKLLKEYGNLIRLSAGKCWFEIEVLYKITGMEGCGRVSIENKRGEGTIL